MGRFSKRDWIGLGVLILFLAVCVVLIFNPLGAVRLSRKEDEVRSSLKNLKPGASVEDALAFMKRHGLKDDEGLSSSLPEAGFPPRTRYWLYASDPEQYQRFGMVAWIAVSFWFDKDKRLISAKLDRKGAGL